jgi:hypothetical protein
MKSYYVSKEKTTLYVTKQFYLLLKFSYYKTMNAFNGNFLLNSLETSFLNNKFANITIHYHYHKTKI